MSERMSNEAVVERGLDALGASGVGAGEVFLKEARSGSVEIKDGAVENVIARGERGIGVRILDAQRLGFAHSSDLSEEGIVACVEQAKRMSGVTEPDADLGLATRPLDDVDLDIFQRGLEDRAVGEFAEVALAVEAAARPIAPLFSADNVLKGRSLFAGKVGQGVANEKVTIVDDARRPQGLRSAPFDGEGVATTTRTLVEAGVLRGYLTSLKTARKMKVEPTGNARRGGYGSPSRIGPSNYFMAAGTDDAVALTNALDRALAITSLHTCHTIDPVSGEFSLGATGNYLERGARAFPVQGITIAGNLTQLLGAIVAVGTDLVFGPSGLGSPTLVISELSIGGA